jgi:transposase
MTPNSSSNSRVIGLDSHPDSFTAAVLIGQTPAAAQVEKLFHKVPMIRLGSWAQKHTLPEDLVVLEASGNSFQVVRSLEQVGRKALVLESCQMGKLKEAHANNDKISAVRIGKAYLAGTAKQVWIPDRKSQERRDWFQAYKKCEKRTTQLSNRLVSYLSDNGVRLKQDRFDLESIRKAREWTPSQWLVIETLLLEIEHGQQMRSRWESLMAQEVINDPLLLSLVRLCGIREKIAFALGAIIGDIHRFANPKKLVAYFGFNPAFDDSGKERWQGGIGGHGRKDMRCLLIQAAQAILRSPNNPLAKWGRKLLARKGVVNLAIAAIARKLTVAIWYLMMGRWTSLEEIDKHLALKVGKIITHAGSATLKQIGKNRKEYRLEIYDRLKSVRFDRPCPIQKTT